jgi:hypothetical protein
MKPITAEERAFLALARLRSCNPDHCSGECLCRKHSTAVLNSIYVLTRNQVGKAEIADLTAGMMPNSWSRTSVAVPLDLVCEIVAEAKFQTRLKFEKEPRTTVKIADLKKIERESIKLAIAVRNALNAAKKPQPKEPRP